MTYVITLNVAAPDDFTEAYVGQLVSMIIDDGVEGSRRGLRSEYVEEWDHATELAIDVLTRGTK